MRGCVLALALLTGAVALPAQNLSGVKAIAASGNTSFALLSDGTVWWWGQDDLGWEEVLGGGQATPVRWGNLTDVVAISPGLALKVDGTVWAYRLGTNALRVPGLGWVVAVATGEGFSNLALTGDGNVWVFGSPVINNGKAEWSVYNTVTRVSGVTEIVAIAAGARNSLAVKRDGTVWTWGDNQDGSLGDGLTNPASTVYGPILSTPVQVPGLGDVVAVAAGYGHSLALKSDGTVWVWGFNGHGQLGDGTTETRTTPFQMSGLAGVVRIAAGDAHSVAVKGDGTVWAWGSNVGGQLGDGTTTDRLAPVQVSGLSGTATVAAGRFHNLALKDDGTVWAWGDNQFGQLGDGGELQPDPYTAPLGPLQVGGLTGVTKIAAGLTHSLALKSDGTLWAWGDNSFGELGDGTTRALDWPDRSTPVKVSGLAGVVAIAGGYDQSLAVTGDGAVWAWGSNTGMGGGPYEPYTSTPLKVSGLTGVVAIAGGYGQSLAVTGDGAVWAWGSDGWPGAYTWTPVQVRGLSGVVSVAAGFSVESYSTADFWSGTYYHLAVREDGSIWRWGVHWTSSHGRALDPVPVGPVPMAGFTDVVAVAASIHSLALKRDGAVWAWGDNFWGELGDGTRTERAAPVQVAGLSDVAAIDTNFGDMFIGLPHSVALKRDGTVWEWPIWEWSIAYQSLVPKSLTPVQVAGLTDIVAVAAGGGHSLALKRDGTVWAWGQNIYGQLGVRTFAIRTTPVQVVAPAP